MQASKLLLALLILSIMGIVFGRQAVMEAETDDSEAEDATQIEADSEGDSEDESDASVRSEGAIEVSEGHWLNACPHGACPFHSSCISNLRDPRPIFTCSCDVGYYKDGKLCLESLKCMDEPCAKNAECADDGRGGFACLCKPGYAGDARKDSIKNTGCKPLTNLIKATKKKFEDAEKAQKAKMKKLEAEGAKKVAD